MRFLRALGRTSAILIVVVGAVLIGGATRAARGPAVERPEEAAAARSISPTPTAASVAADCVDLARVPPHVAPSLAISDLGNGTKRIASAEGGYELTVPSDWLVSGSIVGSLSPSFGQVHVTSYDPRSLPTPDPERMMLPPSAGIAVDVQIWSNSGHETLSAYASHIRIGPDQTSMTPGTITTIDGQATYRFTINDEHRFKPTNAPLVVTTQTHVVWLIESERDDRIIVAYATPGESDLLPIVERAVDTLKVTMPVASEHPVVRQRSDVLRQWLVDKTGVPIAGRRAEAKLVTYADAAEALDGRPSGSMPPVQLLRLDHDPEDLYWVIAVSGGPGLPQPGRPLVVSPSASPAGTSWIEFSTSATSMDAAGTGMRIAIQGTWPPDFDTLRDLCH